MLVVPVLQTIIFGYAIETEIENIPTVVYDLDGRRALGERKDGARLGHAAPADVVRHEPRLARRDADELRSRLNRALCVDSSHQRFFTWVFWSPAWPRK